MNDTVKTENETRGKAMVRLHTVELMVTQIMTEVGTSEADAGAYLDEYWPKYEAGLITLAELILKAEQKAMLQTGSTDLLVPLEGHSTQREPRNETEAYNELVKGVEAAKELEQLEYEALVTWWAI